jgi:hypothetical protein
LDEDWRHADEEVSLEGVGKDGLICLFSLPNKKKRRRGWD